MSNDDERMRILQQIEDGQISAAEGLRRLDPPVVIPPAPKTPPRESAPPDPGLDYWRRWWLLPLFAGIGIVLFGGLLMFAAYQAGGLGFWFGVASLPFIFGVIVMALAASSRSARWLHIRVKNVNREGEWPRNISLSFPLPIRFTAWVLRMVGPHVPQLKDHGLDELILSLAESTSTDSPLYVDVADGQGGEHVQVYIG
ncbi:MAG: hypothetical protein ABI847_07055 [Anaerolineales bacterium]